jgi:hypothetical protein
MPAIVNGPGALSETYAYDRAGNATTFAGTPTAYDANDRITSTGYAFDNEGRLTQSPDPIPKTNLVMWVDASGPLDVDASSNVTRWRDLSGYGSDALPYGTIAKPRLVTSGLPAGTVPAKSLRFDNATLCTATTSAFRFTNKLRAFMVINPDTRLAGVVENLIGNYQWRWDERFTFDDVALPNILMVLGGSQWTANSSSPSRTESGNKWVSAARKGVMAQRRGPAHAHVRGRWAFSPTRPSFPKAAEGR